LNRPAENPGDIVLDRTPRDAEDARCARILGKMTEIFDVFLSHNSRDKPAVREVAQALRGRGLKVWLDEWELIPGRPWLEALERVIESIGCAAVLVGKDGLGPWEAPEMRACLSEFVSRSLPVIPVLLPGAPEKPALPFFLKQFTWADLRAGLTAEGLSHLEWGITGKKPELRQGAPDPILAASQEDEAPKEFGQPFIEPLTGIRFLSIPGGRFQMGSDIYRDEEPIHWVRISPFWLGETPVTNQQYRVFLETTGFREPAYWCDERFSAPHQPVGSVNWEDAQAFCAWLSDISSRRMSLPCEAQWEFAARGTDGRAYPWGNQPPDETRACFGLDPSDPEKGRPAEVGSFPAGCGPFGTLDQAGNVWEWCRDAWNPYAYERRTRVGGEHLDPINELFDKDKEGCRVLRGGGWFHSAGQLRSTYRFNYQARKWLVDFGFRVAAMNSSPSTP